MKALQFLVAILATWRVTSLLSREHGPADIFDRLRLATGAQYEAGHGNWVSTTFLGKMITCFYCCSIWVAVGVLLGRRQLPSVTEVLAVSGGACLVDKATNR